MYYGETYLTDGGLNARERELGVRDVWGSLLLSSRRNGGGGFREQGMSTEGKQTEDRDSGFTMEELGD